MRSYRTLICRRAGRQIQLSTRSKTATGLALISVCLFAMAPASFAQWPPLRIGMTNALVNESGHTLKGNHPASSSFGSAHIEGDLVHVLDVTAGLFPPDASGYPHSQNTVLYTARVGEGVSPLLTESGMFSASVSQRPVGKQICVRVYNATTIEEASFYVDSQVHAVSGTADPTFIVALKQTSIPIDPNDDDGDGLNNSWEKSYGSNKDLADSDGDGVNDGEEHTAGSDPVDAASYLAVRHVAHVAAGVEVEWESVPGRTYVVERLSPLIPGQSYEAVTTPVEAADIVTRLIVSDGSQDGACYRVRMEVE